MKRGSDNYSDKLQIHYYDSFVVRALDSCPRGVKSGKVLLLLAAGFIKTTLWRGLAQCFDFDSPSGTQSILPMPLLYIGQVVGQPD